MARKGLPAKYAKQGFAKGWKAYKAAQRKRKRVSGTSIKRSTTKKRSSTTMAKRKTTKRRVYKRRAATPIRRRRRMGRRMPKILTAATLNTIIDGIVMGGSAIGSTLAINFIPWIRDQRPIIKSAIQAGLGAVAMPMTKNRLAKKAAMGAIVGSAITALLPYLPGEMKVFGGREFTEGELAALQTMGKPYSLGKPLAMPQPSMAGRGSYRSRTRAR